MRDKEETPCRAITRRNKEVLEVLDREREKGVGGIWADDLAELGTRDRAASPHGVHREKLRAQHSHKRRAWESMQTPTSTGAGVNAVQAQLGACEDAVLTYLAVQAS